MNFDFKGLMDFSEENPISQEKPSFCEENKTHFEYENDIKVHKVTFPKDFHKKNPFIEELEEAPRKISHTGENPFENKELSTLSSLETEENKRNAPFLQRTLEIFSRNLKKNKKDLDFLKIFEAKNPPTSKSQHTADDGFFEGFLEKMSEKSQKSFKPIIKLIMKKFAENGDLAKFAENGDLAKFAEIYREKLPPMILQMKEDPLRKELLCKELIEKEKSLDAEIRGRIEAKKLEKNMKKNDEKIEEFAKISTIFKEIHEETMKKNMEKAEFLQKIEEIELKNIQLVEEIEFLEGNKKKTRVLAIGYEISQINRRKYEGFLKRIGLNLEEIQRKLREKAIPKLKSVFSEENSKKLLVEKLEKKVIFEKNKLFTQEKSLLNAKNEVAGLEKEGFLRENERKSTKSLIKGLIEENMSLYKEENEKFPEEKPVKNLEKNTIFSEKISALNKEEKALLSQKSSLHEKISMNSLEQQRLSSQKSSFLRYFSKPEVPSKPSFTIMKPFPFIVLFFIVILKFFLFFFLDFKN